MEQLYEYVCSAIYRMCVLNQMGYDIQSIFKKPHHLNTKVYADAMSLHKLLLRPNLEF